MLSFFMADPERVRWDLTSLDDGCRLTVYHAHGTIVEHFRTVHAALLRQQQLEQLLLAARMH